MVIFIFEVLYKAIHFLKESFSGGNPHSRGAQQCFNGSDYHFLQVEYCPECYIYSGSGQIPGYSPWLEYFRIRCVVHIYNLCENLPKIIPFYSLEKFLYLIYHFLSLTIDITTCWVFLIIIRGQIYHQNNAIK